ncbi:MAG: hypothetical protein ACXAAI_10460 [Promethearchaeota archaeon]|jgi:hypothetical protein
MNGLNHKKLILTIFSSFLIIFGLIHLSSPSFAAINPKEMKSTISFQMQEYTSLSGEFNDTSSIEIDLYTTESNITMLDIDINNLRVEVNETIIIEENGGSQYCSLSTTQNEAMAIQLNITEPTKINGVEIYGRKANELSCDAYVQIKGYNFNTNYPTFVPQGPSADLNMSTTLGWHTQMFPEPVYLDEGYYYLVIRAPNPQATQEYRWYYNSIDPQYPNLYAAFYEEGAWDDLMTSHVFQHKLIQSVNKSVKPSDIDLKVEVDSIIYDLNDGAIFNSGSMTLENLSLQLTTDTFQIPVYHNSSSTPSFSYTYNLSLITHLYSEGTLTIKENSYNTWNILPNISRHGYNQTIKFKCPDDWNDIVLYKNGADITSELLFFQDYFYIMNTTISNDSDWLISARSYLYDYEIDCFKDNIAQGGMLSVSVQIPEGTGIAILKIFNSQGIEIFNETKIVDSILFDFNYSFPSNIPSGIYYAYVFWQNNIDAGVQSHAFYISFNENWVKDNLSFLILLISVILVVSGVVSSYLVLKSRRRKNYTQHEIPESKLKESTKLYEKIVSHKFLDVFNLKYIIISEKLSGLYVFEEAFQDVDFDPLLVSGFIGAIKSFGKEVINIDTDNQILNIEYQTSNIYLVELSCFNFILIMGTKPSNEFLLAVDNLVEEIDYRYGELIEGYQGDITKFDGIIEIIEKYLDVNLLYPFNFNANLNYTFTPEEKEVLYKAYDVMKQTNQNYFYLSQILSETKFDLKIAEIILKFISQDIFIPNRE